MAKKPSTTTAQLDASVRDLAREIEALYDAWIAQHPGLASPVSQMAIFTMAGKRLAQSGVGLTPVVRQAFRAFGLNADHMVVERSCTGEVIAERRETPSGVSAIHTHPSPESVLVQTAGRSRRRDH